MKTRFKSFNVNYSRQVEFPSEFYVSFIVVAPTEENYAKSAFFYGTFNFNQTEVLIRIDVTYYGYIHCDEDSLLTALWKNYRILELE